MRQLFLVLGIASIFFAQRMSAQMDDIVGDGSKFPPQECIRAAKTFAWNVKGEVISIGPETENQYQVILESLNKASRHHQQKIEKMKARAKGTTIEMKKSLDSQIAAKEKTYEAAMEALKMDCFESVVWQNGEFIRGEIKGEKSMGSSAPKKVTN